jgi:hypothetical protein
VQLCDVRHQAVFGDVVEDFALDAERPSGELHLHLAMLADVLDAIPEQMGDMDGIGGRRDGDDCLRIRNPPGGGKDRRAAETVPDQDRGRPTGFPQMIGGADEIGDVGREGRICKFALAGAEPSKVEPQYRDALGCQCDRNAFGRQHVLAAGEAMREQRVSLHRSIRRIQRGSKLMAAFAGELKAFARHGRSPWIE